LSNIVAALGTQVWSSLLGLIILPVLVRSFGAQAYGIMALSLSIVGIASVGDLGIGRAVSKYISEESDTSDDLTDRHVPTALTIVALLSLLTTSALLVITPYLVTTVFTLPRTLLHSASLSFVYTSVAMPAVLARILFDGILVGHHRITSLSAINAASNTLKLLGGVAVALFVRRIELLVMVCVVITYFQATALAWMCIRGAQPLVRLRLGWRPDIARKLLKLGSLTTIANSICYLFLYLDRWLIAIFLPIGVVGIYSVTYDIASKQWYLANSISQAYFPVFSRHSRSRFALTQDYVRATKMSVIGETGAGVVLALFQAPLLAYWIEPRFAGSAALIGSVLSVALMMACYANIPLTALLAACERPQAIAKLYVGGIAVHIVVSIAAIRILGGLAVAIGLTAGYAFIMLGASLWLTSRTLEVGLSQLLRSCFLRSWASACVTIVPLSVILKPRLHNLSAVLVAMCTAYLAYLCFAWRLSYDRTERVTMWTRASSSAYELVMRMRTKGLSETVG
jgi:O-antigen/teichoic acid export membrane protein